MRLVDKRVSPYLALLIVTVVGVGATLAILRAIALTEELGTMVQY
jgi:hypothetical protein